MTDDWATIGEQERALLAGRAFGHVATIMRDGSPHVAPVWLDCDGDEVLFVKDEGSVAARNLRRDPRIALSATTCEDPYRVVALRGVVVDMRRGAAVQTWLDATSRRYLGTAYPEPVGAGVLMVVRAVRVRMDTFDDYEHVAVVP